MNKAVKLRCEDEEDVVVLSSLLQDALVPLADMAWLPEERRFVFVASRFVWETCPDVTGPSEQADRVAYARCHFGVTFETVRSVQSRGIDLAERERILELLAITAERGDTGGASFELVFAGEAGVRMAADRIFVHGQDIGEAWPTPWRPRHPGVEAA